MRGHLGADIAKQNDYKKDHAFIKTLLQWAAAILRIDLGLVIWIWAHRLKEAREKHASSRNLWRQAACCIGLAALRVFGGR